MARVPALDRQRQVLGRASNTHSDGHSYDMHGLCRKGGLLFMEFKKASQYNFDFHARPRQPFFCVLRDP